MSDASPNLALPYILPAQAQKHVTHNEALRRLDALVQLSVVSAGQTVPPATPAAGERHIVGPGATQAWEGMDGRIALWEDSAWAFLTAAEGWTAWVGDIARHRVFDGTAWQAAGLAADLQNLSGVGINTGSDAVNRLAVAAQATLLGHDGAGHQVKVNKAGPGDTASLLFQTGWSGRAEMGTAGSDDFAIKVSADGALFNTALSIGAADAVVVAAAGLGLGALPADPAAPADGRLWYNGSGARLKARIGGRTVTVGDDELAYCIPEAGRWVRTTIGVGANTTTVNGVVDRVDIYPYVPKYDFTADRIGVNVVTGVAGAQGRILVYASNDSGHPAGLVLETGVLDLSGTGPREVTVALGLGKGKQYWVGFRHSANATLSAFQPHTCPELDQGGIETVSNKVLRRALAFGTPAPAVWAYSSAHASSVNPVAIWLRVAP